MDIHDILLIICIANLEGTSAVNVSCYCLLQHVSTCNVLQFQLVPFGSSWAEMESKISQWWNLCTTHSVTEWSAYDEAMIRIAVFVGSYGEFSWRIYSSAGRRRQNFPYGNQWNLPPGFMCPIHKESIPPGKLRVWPWKSPIFTGFTSLPTPTTARVELLIYHGWQTAVESGRLMAADERHMRKSRLVLT